MIDIGNGISVLSAQAIYATIWSLTSFAIAVTLLRLYTRAFIVKALGLDDALIFFGLIGSVAVSAIQHWHVHLVWASYYTSRDSDVNYPKLYAMLDLIVFSVVLGDGFAFIFLPIIKCSILAFYRRISPSKKHHRLLYFVAAVMIIHGVLNILLKLFALDPPTAWMHFWSDQSYREIYDFKLIHIINSAFQVLFDITILLLPLPIIYRTRFKRRQRIGLVTIYLLSFLSLAATVARLVSLKMFFGQALVFNASALMQERIKYSLWITIEIMTVVICANLPTMPALLWVMKRAFLKIFSNKPPSSSPTPYLYNPYPYPLPFYGNTSSHAFSTSQKTSSSADSKGSWVKEKWSRLSNLTTRLYPSSKDASSGEKMPQPGDNLVARTRMMEGKDSISFAATREIEMIQGNKNINHSSSSQLSGTASLEHQQGKTSTEEVDLGVAVVISPKSPTSNSGSSSHGEMVGLAGATNHEGVSGIGGAADGVIYVTDEVAVERTAA